MMLRRHKAYMWLRGSVIAGMFNKYGVLVLSLIGMFATYDISSVVRQAEHPTFYKWLIFIQNQSFTLFLAVLVVMIVLAIWGRNNVSTSWGIIQKILDGYSKKVFDAGTNKDEHRVTLFQKCKRNLPQENGIPFWKRLLSLGWFGTYLIPVIRSGHLTKKSKSKFRIYDSGSKCKGVAGRAYVTDHRVAIDSLPDLSPHAVKSLTELEKQDRVKAYAEKTFCDESFVLNSMRKGRPLARSIAATTIQVHGEIWGVLVVDSSDPTAINEGTIEEFTVLIQTIGYLLERP